MKPRHRHIILALLAVALLLVYAHYDPAKSHWMPQCPVKLLTGLQCPGCGAQRFLHALLQGHFKEAIAYNYFFLPTLPLLLLLIACQFMPERKARKMLVAVLEHKIVIIAYVSAYFIWFVVRNIWHI